MFFVDIGAGTIPLVPCVMFGPKPLGRDRVARITQSC